MENYQMNLKPLIERILEMDGKVDVLDILEYVMESLPGDLVIDYHLSGRTLGELQDFKITMELDQDFEL